MGERRRLPKGGAGKLRQSGHLWDVSSTEQQVPGMSSEFKATSKAGGAVNKGKVRFAIQSSTKQITEDLRSGIDENVVRSKFTMRFRKDLDTTKRKYEIRFADRSGVARVLQVVTIVDPEEAGGNYQGIVEERRAQNPSG